MAPVAYSKTFMIDREVCARLKLAPGRYCVVPSTMAANEEGEFIVRIFSEMANTIPKYDLTTNRTAVKFHYFYLLEVVKYFKNNLWSLETQTKPHTCMKLRLLTK